MRSTKADGCHPGGNPARAPMPHNDAVQGAETAATLLRLPCNGMFGGAAFTTPDLRLGLRARRRGLQPSLVPIDTERRSARDPGSYPGVAGTALVCGQADGHRDANPASVGTPRLLRSVHELSATRQRA